MVPMLVSACFRHPICPEEELGPRGGLELLQLAYGLSVALSQNPGVYPEGEQFLWMHFARSEYLCDALTEEQGVRAAAVSSLFPVVFCGGVDTEPVEILYRFAVDKTLLCEERRSASGRNFDRLEELCVRVAFPDARSRNEWKTVLGRIDYQRDFVALERTCYVETQFSACAQCNGDTYFRYLPLSASCRDTDSCVAALPVPLQKRLWRLFLVDGVSPVEFEFVWERLAAHMLEGGFAWALSLRLALSEAGVQLGRSGEGFHLRTPAGQRRTYDYENGTPAEKLFLKLLYPASPRALKK